MNSLQNKRLEKVLKKISKSPKLEVPIKYHASECINSRNNSKVNGMPNLIPNKLLDCINDYHMYCNLCQHHYYSSSKLNDINSFFQIHINSIDHIWNKGNSKWDNEKPIFIWEELLCTGFCEICKKSGIEAFIVDTEFDILNIVQMHLKTNGHTRNYELINKKPFCQILAKSDLFSKIYIDDLSNDKYLCKICNLKIEREALLEHHLCSDVHCRNFCEFMKKELNVCIGDEKVDLDLDELARRTMKLPALARSTALINKKNAFKTHKIDELAKSEIDFLVDPLFGFSPSAMKKAHSVEDEDLRQVTYCALCHESPIDMDRHLSSNSHQLRVMVFDRCRSVHPVSLSEYLYTFRSNPKKLKCDVEKYKKFWLFLKKQNMDFGVPCNQNLFSPDLKEDNEGLSDETSDNRSDFLASDFRESLQIHSLNLDEDTEVTNQTPQNPVAKETKSKQKKKQSIDIKMKTAKMSKKDCSVVWKFMKYFCNKTIVPRKKGFFCQDCNCDISREEMERHVKEKGHKKCYIMRYLGDPDFVNVIEVWSINKTDSFVCILCGRGVSCSKSIFNHIKKSDHVKRYEKLRNGSLKPISPMSYSVNMQRKLYVCDNCGSGICDLKKFKKSYWIYEAVKAINAHETNCPGIETFDASFDINNLRKKFEKKILIEQKSKEVEIAKGKAQLKMNCKTDEKNGKKSPSTDSILEEEVASSHGTAKLKEKEKSVMDGGKTITEKTESSGKAQNLNSKSDVPSPKENLIKQNLYQILKLCPVELTEYLCGICLVSASISTFEDHLESEKHRLNEKYITSKWTIQPGFCKFCKILTLGTIDMSRQHYCSSYHMEQESSLLGTQITNAPLRPRIIKVLVIKGIPNLPKLCKEKYIHLLFHSFGVIKRIRVKTFSIEVEFADERVIGDIVAVKKIEVNEKTSLTFSVKNIWEELEIVMKTSMIYMLTYDRVDVIVSYLVGNAKKRLSSEEENQKEEMLCQALVKVMKIIYPNCKYFKFGSRVTGLTLEDSDLDVFLDYDNVYCSENQDPKMQEKLVKVVVAALKASIHFSNITGIAKCRVPIVTCLHKETSIYCDISFRNGLSCENTNLIKFMISLDDRVKALTLFLKYWAQENGLHGKPNFSSYALTMIVFFYLQQLPNPVLPTVDFLKRCYGKPKKVIGGWDCGFTTNPKLVPKTKNMDSVTQLILGFFNFCETFDFKNNVISPLTGKPLSRKSLENMEKHDLPMPYDKYQSQISPGHYSPQEFICVMDPFDLNHNLTKSFPSSSYTKFLYLCQVSANVLSNSLEVKYYI